VFNLVGLCGFAVQIAAIAVLTRRCGWSSLAATAAGLELAALQNFIAHSTWTWHERRAASITTRLGRFWRYQVAKTASLGANLAITALLVHAGLPPEVANTAAVLLCAVPNYLVSSHFVFQDSSS
jgi:putative flippase GtrA